MRPIEIRGEMHDIDALIRRGRFLHGEAFRGCFAAVGRAVGRAWSGLAQWRRNRAPSLHARSACVNRAT